MSDAPIFRDGRLDKRELFGFHAKKLGLDLSDEAIGGVDGDDTDAAPNVPDADAAGTAPEWGSARRRPCPSGWQGTDEAQTLGHVGHELEYAAHNEAFDWHDNNGDGLLDHVELGMYLLPAAHNVRDGFADEESARLLEVLRAAASLGGDKDGVGRDDPDDASESFGLEHVLSAGSQFLAAFDASMHSFMHEGDTEDQDERDL